MEGRVKLKVLGLSYSPMKSGAFALLMAQEDGPYRIPIVIGAAEAQSIAIQLERIVTPRPITHDLFVSFSHAFKIELQEVYIYKFEDGIFSSELTFTDGINTVKLDSRTSDAIAIALRTNAPIYTTEEILLATGTIFKDEGLPESKAAAKPQSLKGRLEDMPTEDLEKELDRLIAEENYEEAAKISQILKQRKQ